MRKNFIQAVLFGGCMLAAISCGKAPAGSGMVMEYAVTTITTGDSEVQSPYSASIRGRQEIGILPQVGGTISKVLITEGQRVREGQSLFVIDQVPYKAALQTALANVAAAKAGVATAQLAYDSKKELHARNIVSEFDLQMAENNLLTAKAQLAQAEAAEINARNSLSYTEVKSPANGVVGTIPYRVGALVGPSMPKPLTTVADNSEMYVYFSMNESQVLNLTRKYGSIDNALKVMPDVQLQLSDGSIYEQPGRIESISGVVDSSTGSVLLRAVFPNAGGLLLSGSTGNVIVPSKWENVIVIPQSNTFEMLDRIYVYKVVDGLAQAQHVEVAPQNDGTTYIVTAGLQEGDVILAEGVSRMREGTPIQPKGAAPAVEEATEELSVAEQTKEE